VVAPLEAIVARLAAAEPSPYRFRVIVLKSDVVNAFALPGGTIVVCRGLLDEAARAEQVAGVLAHEMSHIRRRHQTVLYFERSALDALLTLVGWTSGTVATRGLRLGAGLGELHFSRENEAEADRMGFDLMVQARVDPRGMGEFLRILDDISASGGIAVELVSTHPETGKRIEDMRRLEALVRSRAWEPVMAPRAWKAFREALRATPP
jgi:predicted Zn-dependent protease